MLDFMFNRKNVKAYTFSRVILALLTSCIYISTVYCTCGMWFETNDDVYLSEIMSGKITGNPEFHCTFLNPIVSLPISLLYRATTVIPWWGVFIFIILCLVVFSISFSMLFVSGNFSRMLIGLTLLLGNYLLSIYIICQSQFTSAAMLLAFCGYVILLCMNQSKAAYVLFLLFELLSCAVRYESMVIAQPICFLFLASFLYQKNADSSHKWQKTLKEALKYGISLIVIMGVIFGVSFVAFRDEELREFKNSDYVLEYFDDYQNSIPYERLESILSKYNISEDEYEHYMKYRYLYPDKKFTNECFKELLPVLKEIRSKEDIDFNLCEAIFQLLFTSKQFWHFHQLTLLLFLLVLVLGIILHKRNWLHPIVATFLGYLVGIVALALRNRFVFRVMIPYYLGTCILLSVILLLMLSGKKECKEEINIRFGVVCSFLIVYVIAAVCVGKSFFSYGRRQNSVVNNHCFSEMNEIMDYCNSHKEWCFLLDMDYARYVSTPVFESNYYQKANCCYSGSWFSKTPSINEYAADYLDKNEIYYMVYEAQEWRGLEGLHFYASEYESEPTLVERFVLSTGATMWVYRIDNNLK